MSRSSFPFAAVLFDMDGVLVDNTELQYRIWREFAHPRGYVPTEAEMLATNGRPARETVRLWLGQGRTDDEILAMAHERETHGGRLLETEAVTPVPGVAEFIAALDAAGIPKAIATGAMPGNARLTLERAGLHSRFSSIITAADVRHGKPHPEIYLKAAASIDADPKDCLVFEDALNGIRAAKAAGAKVVGVATTFDRQTLLSEGVDWMIADFLHLPSELRLPAVRVA